MIKHTLKKLLNQEKYTLKVSIPKGVVSERML